MAERHQRINTARSLCRNETGQQRHEAEERCDDAEGDRVRARREGPTNRRSGSLRRADYPAWHSSPSEDPNVITASVIGVT